MTIGISEKLTSVTTGSSASLGSELREQIPDVGTWLKWTADGVGYRGKLAWHSLLTGKCIFVNHNGLALAEMDEQQLAYLLRHGDAETLPEIKKPFMDGILDSMQSVLNDGERKRESV